VETSQEEEETKVNFQIQLPIFSGTVGQLYFTYETLLLCIYNSLNQYKCRQVSLFFKGLPNAEDSPADVRIRTVQTNQNKQWRKLKYFSCCFSLGIVEPGNS
jgi:hypothetical protein